jgi:predicted ArsR family transcriptional regulator
MASETQAVILSLLKELHFAGAAELAARIGISPAGVRYHLAKLRTTGLIEDCPDLDETEPAAPGRPARHYRLPLNRTPDNLQGLCAALLRLLTRYDNSVWSGLAEQMVDLPAERASKLHLLAFAVSKLNLLNYQAGWEAGPHGPRIRLNNCPYAAIWHSSPEICRLDAAILARLTAAEARQVARTAFGAEGPASCLFEIREKHT